MATAAQIAANRLNAQKSTGPRTPEGKSAARFNALKHGVDAVTIVIPGEDPAAYEALAADYYERFRPQSAVEEFHVDTLIRSDWQKRRLQRAEAKLYRALLAEGSTPEDFDVAILLDSPTAKLLRKVFAQINSLDRAYFRALGDLRRVQRESNAVLSPLDTMTLDAACAPVAPSKIPELGSFPQNRPSPPPAKVLDNPALRL